MLSALFPLALAFPFASPRILVGGDVDEQHDVTELSLEELMDIEVSVASRTQQHLSDAPAAVYVLTGDEIRRAGHTTVAEAMRMVPGFLVGHWYTSLWDVTSRGFTSGFNNNLLVMIDGQNVYDQLSPDGVVWHLQEMDMQQIDRIEIVRGPGGALWGNNAVNGVINVITKKASESQGVKVAGLVGYEEQRGVLRYGGTLGDDGHFRVYALGVHRDALRGYSTSGSDQSFQDYFVGRIGFRGDWNYQNGDSLTLIGTGYDASLGEQYTVGYPTPPFFTTTTDHTPETGGNAILTWVHPHDDGDEDRVTGSYLRSNLKEVDFHSSIDVLELEWQRLTHFNARNTFTYGLSTRLEWAELDGDFIYAFEPEDVSTWNVRLFGVDDIAFPELDLRVVLGAGVDHNEFTGTEFQPTLRSIWSPHEQHTVWGALSRAVRIPSVQENYYYAQEVLGGVPTDIALTVGNQDIESENLLAYELGWRWKPHEKFGFDIATFYNHLDDLVTNETQAPFTQGGITYFPTTYENLGRAQAWGVEIGADAVVSENWRLRAAYTFYEQRNDVSSASSDTSFESKESLVPDNIANLRSYFDLGQHWELDSALYYVDSISQLSTPAYVRADLRLGYSPSADWQFALGVQNLCDPTHPEDGGYLVQRNLWASLTWRH